MFKAPTKFCLAQEVNSSSMATASGPFRRPKGKGGTKSGGINDRARIGTVNGHLPSGARNIYSPEKRHNFATEYKIPKTNVADGTGRRRRRTAEDFLAFCKMVLDYENYEEVVKQEDIRRRNSCSPLGSTGSSNESWLPSKEDDSDFREKNSSEDIDYGESVDSAAVDGDVEDAGDEDDEGWDMITCFCGKPFAGRPMIECSGCYTWIHIKCARLKRTHIPEIWYCTKCRESDPGLVSTSKTKMKTIKTKSASSTSSGDCLSPVSPMEDFQMLNQKGHPKTGDSKNKEKIIGSRKRKMSSAFTKVNTYKQDSTKPLALPAQADESRGQNSNLSNCPGSAFSDRHSTSSLSSCPSGSGIRISSSVSISQSNVEKSWDDSGLESASVSPVSGPRQSEEETDSASSSGHLIPQTRTAKKKKFPSKSIKSNSSKKRINSVSR